MLLDVDELLQLPVVGERARETARRTPIAMAGERFVTPLAVPAPWRFRRFYFAFGQPIETSHVDARDRPGKFLNRVPHRHATSASRLHTLCSHKLD
jgi:hypothetical protein